MELRSPLLPYLTVPASTRRLSLMRLQSRISTPSGRGVAVTTRYVSDIGVRMRVTSPSDGASPRPGVLWIHGGGYVVGSPQLEAFGQGRLARELGVVVVAPKYRLAPEHPFPAALDDCMASLTWMRVNAGELGIDSDRIAVMGASAGGGLAAAVAQRSHDEGIPLRAQVLVYPMLDDRAALRADHAGRGRLLWTPSWNLFGWTAYLGREPRMSDAPQYAAPARRPDLAGLPPAWVGVGELDLLYDEDVGYAERLRDCGVLCELVTVPGMYHGADGLAPKAPSLKAFRDGMLEHLRSHL